MKRHRFLVYFETYLTPIIQFVRNISSILQTWQNDLIWRLFVFWFHQKPLPPYVSCHECLQQSRFWVPGCDPCLPAVCDHLSWATIFAWPTGWSLYTGFTIYIYKWSVCSAIISSIYLYPSGLLHWHWGNHMIAPVPVKQPWRIWVKVTGTKPQHTTAKCKTHCWNCCCWGCTSAGPP